MRPVTLLTLALLIPVVATADTWTVTSTADSGPGTLRQAILDMNADSSNIHSVEFALPPESVIVLTQPLPWLNRPLVTISGPGRDQLTIDGDFTGRIFAADTDVDILTVRDLTLKDGRTSDFPGGCLSSHNFLFLDRLRFVGCEGPDGGAVFSTGNTTIRECHFESNTAVGPDTSYGGAVYVLSDEDVEILRSTFDDNLVSSTMQPSSSTGGAVFIQRQNTGPEVTIEDCHFTANVADPVDLGYGGALGAVGVHRLDIARSTFTENRAGDASAILVYDPTTDLDRDQLQLENVTVYGNTAEDDGAVTLDGVVASLRNVVFGTNSGVSTADLVLWGSFADARIEHMHNTLFGGTGQGDHCGGPLPLAPLADLATFQYNLFTDSSCGVTHPTSAVVSDAGLGNLVDRGGWVPVVDLLPTSPAVEAGHPDVPDPGRPETCTDEDAIGVARPFDGDADTVPRCDIGATEYGPIFLGDFERGSTAPWS